MNNQLEEVKDREVERMLRARNTSATLKLELVNLRSRLPDKLIFAFEGPEDKLAYSQWIRRLRPGLKYEPHPCKGKGNLLTLRLATLRDVNGLSSGVFFFVDRDFDGLRGQAQDSSTFMTESYSIENVLAEPATVDQLLINEFHCHGNPDARRIIVALYERVYDQFLTLMREPNLRLLASEMHGIGSCGYVAGKIGQLASVTVDDVKKGSLEPGAIVPLKRDISESERLAVDAVLSELDPRMSYRGKFAILFMHCWLLKLAASRLNDPRRFFEGTDLASGVNTAEIGVALLASRSEPPSGLKCFLESIHVAA